MKIEMNKKQIMRFIAIRVADELVAGTLNNLGVGIPTMVSQFVAPEKNIWLHGENGVISIGKAAFEVIERTNAQATDKTDDDDMVDSEGNSNSLTPGTCFFDTSVSFGIIRGGHLHTTVLGTMEVSESGDIANYMVPGGLLAGMGGGMDLCVGAKRVIIAATHTNKGKAKLLKHCKLPLTAVGAANMVVTEMGVFDIKDGHFVVREYNSNYTLEEIQKNTEAELVIPKDVKTMDARYFEEAMKES